jgi:molybdopterin-guanine dinucleotide biosynthesis protein B
VLVASNQRLVLQRQFEQPAQLSVHHLLAEVYDGVDWVLVEGFKTSDLLKVEVWRKASEQAVRYPHDDFVVAIATDSPQDMPEATLRPVLDLNDPYAITEWLLANEDRFDYKPPLL